MNPEEHPAILKAIEAATETIRESAEAIIDETVNRHSQEADMSYGIKIKIPVKTPHKLQSKISFNTPYSLELEMEIEDPNQLKMEGLE